MAPQLKSLKADQEGGHKVSDPMRLTGFRRVGSGLVKLLEGYLECAELFDACADGRDEGIEVAVKESPGQLHGSIQNKAGDGDGFLKLLISELVIGIESSPLHRRDRVLDYRSASPKW